MNKELLSIEEIDAFIQNNRLSMLYFSQENCNVCHSVYPKLKDLLTKFPSIKLAHVDTSNVEEVVGKFLIFSVPTIIMFIDQRESFREGRFVQLGPLAARLQQLNDFWLKSNSGL
ncbi:MULTISPECIES: thioredoxin family protein [Paenibacillus]|uniref:Thioredoxin n=1 Tax=Paenibacillus polymyxa (strain SC2) TaxID=886882 RepID=E3EI07_PAEPS|nr:MULTISPECIES: thioredoxin family protein [Paenibacillus]ADO56596.1 thioredoxin [Paenibacillus polymyxa SC2]AJE49551.1 thioredoxin [Paenibacillus polymyxa]KAF6560062.1 thioredoxin family protein [Paenibacillus sp. EKM202P]KAF6564834.1 thioredoxin family protein [Paenibacillus sp. EKM207P]MBU9709745.1 thioredoxin family protein [Paenibacillus sp. AK121]